MSKLDRPACLQSTEKLIHNRSSMAKTPHSPEELQLEKVHWGAYAKPYK